MKVRSSTLPGDDGHTIIVEVLLIMMMTIVFVIYVHICLIMLIEVIITSSLG